MAIDEQFYDYGPDYFIREVNEKDYDYDFNDDGDKLDLVSIPKSAVSHEFAPGKPW